MSVEVRELIVKVTVRAPARDDSRSNDQQVDDAREEIVAEAVEQVLRILDRRKER